MNILDRCRIERALTSYDWSLDLRGVRRRRRRELRSELKANLLEASHDHGARAAVDRLGSLRQMAAEATPFDPTRPRWSIGLSVGAATLMVTLLVELFAALAWVDGVTATPGEDRATGSLTLFPGSSLSYSSQGPGVTLWFVPGWLCLALALVAFVLASRVWRLRSSRHRDRQSVGAH